MALPSRLTRCVCTRKVRKFAAEAWREQCRCCSRHGQQGAVTCWKPWGPWGAHRGHREDPLKRLWNPEKRPTEYGNIMLYVHIYFHYLRWVVWNIWSFHWVSKHHMFPLVWWVSNHTNWRTAAGLVLMVIICYHSMSCIINWSYMYLIVFVYGLYIYIYLFIYLFTYMCLCIHICITIYYVLIYMYITQWESYCIFRSRWR